MSVTATVLVESKDAENTQTTQYTSSNVRTIIDKFTATNYSASAASLSVNLVAVLSSASNSNLTVKTKTLQAGETYTFPEVVGHILASGDFISTIASASSAINLRVSGRIVT